MPQSRRISEPQLATVTIAQVGEEMVRQGTVTEHDAIHVASPIKVGLLSSYTIMPGYFKKTGEDEGSEYYFTYQGSDSGSISKSAISDPWKSVETFLVLISEHNT